DARPRAARPRAGPAELTGRDLPADRARPRGRDGGERCRARDVERRGDRLGPARRGAPEPGRDRRVPRPPRRGGRAAGVSDAILSVRGLTAGYGEVNVIHEGEIVVAPGSFVSVIGPNGAGKSTLLKTVYGLLKPRAGNILFRPREGVEHEIAGSRPHRLTRLGLNYVPQRANVFPDMSVQESLEVGAAVAGKEAGERVARVVETFPVLRERRRARAGTLSGGQRQMLALARR